MRFITSLMLTLAVTGLSLNAQAGSHGGKDHDHEDMHSVLEIVMDSDQHTTLVAAVKAADLVGTLSGEGPFTIFAPTNEAFAALPEGTVETLLKPENQEQLQNILTYHVVGGNIKAGDLVGMIESEGGTVEVDAMGKMWTAMAEEGSVKLKDAQGNIVTVTATDMVGSNGVVHVIDGVLMP